MKVIISDNRRFEKFIDIFRHAKEVNETFNIRMDNEKMYMQCMDQSHILVLDFELKKEWFDTFEFDEENDNDIYGINAANIFKFLNTKQGNQKMIMSCKPSEDKLLIEFKGDKAKEYNKKFNMSLLEIDCDMISIPESEDEVEFVIEHSNFASSVDQLALFGDTLRIAIDNETINMSSSGMDGDMEIDIKTDDVEEFSAVECDEGEKLLSQSYAIKYIKTMCNFSKVSKWLVIKVSSDRPICCFYKLDNESYVRLYLAPKVDDNDDE